MILDGFTPVAAADGTSDDDYISRSIREMPEIDRWIISRINSIAKQISPDMGEYPTTPDYKTVNEFYSGRSFTMVCSDSPAPYVA